MSDDIERLCKRLDGGFVKYPTVWAGEVITSGGDPDLDATDDLMQEAAAALRALQARSEAAEAALVEARAAALEEAARLARNFPTTRQRSWSKDFQDGLELASNYIAFAIRALAAKD